MVPFEKSKWIWADLESCADQYTEYIDCIEWQGGEVSVRLSCDSDYALYVNGEYSCSGQYADFEHYKIYDEVNVTPLLRKGRNELRLLVYYCGEDFQRYKSAEAGLIYEVTECDRVIAYSSPETLSRAEPHYESGLCRKITPQMCYSFNYDATAEDGGAYAPSREVSKSVTLYPRPIKRLTLLERKPAVSVTAVGSNTLLIDLGEETVGLPTLDLVSNTEQTLHIAWGESLDDGRVRERIGGRAFFFEYRAARGENRYTNPMLRIGCRYLELTYEEPIELRYLGVIPRVWDVEEREAEISDPLCSEIYAACVNTLRLCMMEHYVDTPWREQCLYAFDSRNQMLCGYYAFKDGNRDYARSNLVLLGEDRREDGLLSICAPAGVTLAIPTFSLYYIIAMKEYLDYTADRTLPSRYLGRMEQIIDAFVMRREEGGLVNTFGGKSYWNFYDWSAHLEGSLGKAEQPRPDMVINALTVMALDSYETICKCLGTAFPYAGLAEELRWQINSRLRTAKGLYELHEGGGELTALGNSLAILCGAARNEEARRVCKALVSGELSPSSLSMNVWKYDALMMTDADRYRDYILSDIRDAYEPMLKAGSTTVWETAEGSAAFSNAGSLCHGWSAVPIYVYHKLKIAERKK